MSQPLAEMNAAIADAIGGDGESVTALRNLVVGALHGGHDISTATGRAAAHELLDVFLLTIAGPEGAAPGLPADWPQSWTGLGARLKEVDHDRYCEVFELVEEILLVHHRLAEVRARWVNAAPDEAEDLH